MRISILLILLAISVCVTSCKQGSRVGYAGEDISDKVFIVRDKEGRKATLHVELDEEWRLYGGNSVKTIDFSKPLLSAKGKGVHTLKVSNSRRVYFQLETAKSKMLLAEEHLPMQGVYNCRDLGGLKTEDGRYIKWGKLLRSGDMHRLTRSDLSYLSTVPVVTVIDFRREHEKEHVPDIYPSSQVHLYNLDIPPGKLESIVPENITVEEAAGYLEEMYEMFATDTAYIEQFREFFAILQKETEDGAVLFHCTVGRERVGWAAALVLSALGVSEDLIIEDYLASSGYLAGKYDDLVEKYPVYINVFLLRKNFLISGLNKVRSEYGSVEIFLRKELKVDIEKFRNLYLY